jgi:hypothetical protein
MTIKSDDTLGVDRTIFGAADLPAGFERAIAEESPLLKPDESSKKRAGGLKLSVQSVPITIDSLVVDPFDDLATCRVGPLEMTSLKLEMAHFKLPQSSFLFVKQCDHLRYYFVDKIKRRIGFNEVEVLQLHLKFFAFDRIHYSIASSTTDKCLAVPSSTFGCVYVRFKTRGRMHCAAVKALLCSRKLTGRAGNSASSLVPLRWLASLPDRFGIPTTHQLRSDFDHFLISADDLLRHLHAESTRLRTNQRQVLYPSLQIHDARLHLKQAPIHVAKVASIREIAAGSRHRMSTPSSRRSVIAVTGGREQQGNIVSDVREAEAHPAPSRQRLAHARERRGGG